MLGRRNPQRSLFSAQGLPHRVDPSSFYGQMGALCSTLFRDDDLKHMYCADNGRPGLPPSFMSAVLLLQFYDDVSDREAVERVIYDLRWKVALDVPLDFEGFHPTSLSQYRKRLLRNGEQRYAFDRFIDAAREAGFIPESVTMLSDTTNVKGAGALQDAFTLLRKGVRKLLKELGYAVPGKRRGLSKQVRELIETYVDQDRKASIDWSDPKARAEHLKDLVADVRAALALAAEHPDDPDVATTGWLLSKILGDDIATDEEGNPQIGQRTAPDRIISMTDPEMRHGRKSASHRFNGFKTSVSTDADSEMIMDIVDLPAPGGDGQHLMPIIERVEARTGVTVERVIGDGAYGSGDNRDACADYPDHSIDLVSPLRRPHDPDVDKSAFDIDLEKGQATCPQGHTVSGKERKDRKGKPVLTFLFARADCEQCPLFSRCVRSKSAGRRVTTHRHEALLREARERQETEEFQQHYRQRGRVEAKIAELVYHGLRETRYVGEKKRQLQRLWIGAAVNLKRLFKLAEAEQVDLAAIFANLSIQRAGLATA